MKASLVLVILFSLLGCEKKVVSDEDRARNAVIEWVAKHQPQLRRQFNSVEKGISVDDGVLVVCMGKAVLVSDTTTSRSLFPYLVRSKGGSLKVEEGWGSLENQRIHSEVTGSVLLK